MSMRSARKHRGKQLTWDRLEPRMLLTTLVPGDYDGDQKTDFAVFDPTSATFFVVESGGGRAAVQLGNPASPLIPLVGDYDGDHKTDFAVFDPTSATFFVVGSNGSRQAMQLGNAAHPLVPLTGDYDGDGKTDFAVFDPVTATFYVAESSGGRQAMQLGNAADPLIPLTGDYLGDGKTDFAVFDPITATFFVASSAGARQAQQLGNALNSLVPLVGSYDGSGRDDFAVFDPTTATFYAVDTAGFASAEQLGNASNPLVPLVGDYFGDGKDDFAVFDPTTATFYVVGANGARTGAQIGNGNNPLVPLVGDYNGDGRADFTVFDPTSATFFVAFSTGARAALQLGNPANPLIPLRQVLAPPTPIGGYSSVNPSFNGFNGLRSSEPDINQDGKTDAVIYAPAASTFGFAVTGFVAGIPAFTGVSTVGTPSAGMVPLVGDFNGDGRPDFAVYNAATSTFTITATGTVANRPLYTTVFKLGIPSDHPIPLLGDWNGDGRTDIGVYDPVTSTFTLVVTQPFTNVPVYTLTYQFGVPQDHPIPLVGDFNGDGKTDVALYDPLLASFFWFVTGGQADRNGVTSPLFGGVYPIGNPTHHPIPLVGDFNGDGNTDFAVYDPTTTTFLFNITGGPSGIPLASGLYQFGIPTTHPTPLVGDFNGDGKSDFALYYPTTSVFQFEFTGGLTNNPLGGNIYQLGNPSSHGTPLLGDFNADGKTDVALYDPTTSTLSFAVTGTLNAVPLFQGFLQIGIPTNHPVTLQKGARRVISYYS
jgi:hypothetical protein